MIIKLCKLRCCASAFSFSFSFKSFGKTENRGTHGVSSSMLDTLVSSSENPLSLDMGSVKKGSNNYHKQKIKIARAYEKVRFQRQDWQHKLSTQLADKYDFICVEDLNMQAMARGLHLAKATNDNGFGQFRNMLSYKMEERGKKLITIDKWFPSSKTCRHCGYVNSDLTLNDREWVCPSCGAKIDRDVNAAINIKTEGLRNVS